MLAPLPLRNLRIGCGEVLVQLLDGVAAIVRGTIFDAEDSVARSKASVRHLQVQDAEGFRKRETHPIFGSLDLVWSCPRKATELGKLPRVNEAAAIAGTAAERIDEFPRQYRHGYIMPGRDNPARDASNATASRAVASRSPNKEEHGGPTSVCRTSLPIASACGARRCGAGAIYRVVLRAPRRTGPIAGAAGPAERAPCNRRPNRVSLNGGSSVSQTGMAFAPSTWGQADGK